jgi:D-tyrosyl-tRNA(Tyr) deacylase
MRAVVQRVTEARVVVDDEIIGAIGPGLLVLLGCEQGDTDDDLNYIVAKTIAMRVFGDNDGKMNLSVLERGAQVLLVSQFTLFGDMRKGRRPSFTQAMEPGAARAMYDRAIQRFMSEGVRVATGQFAADMKVSLTNDGPVTILLDSRRTF